MTVEDVNSVTSSPLVEAEATVWQARGGASYRMYAQRVTRLEPGGPDPAADVRAVLEVELGALRTLVVCTPRTLRTAETLAAALDVVGVHTASRVHVPAAMAQDAVALARSTQAEAVLALGGGSVIGTAKVIARDRGLPVVAVPTTYAGSELTPVWGVTSDGHKETGTDERVLPVAVVYAPHLLADLPERAARLSAVNALAHCLDALWAPRRHPEATAFALAGARLLADGLRSGEAGESPELLSGAILGGRAFAAAGSGAHHTICHLVGGALDLPHAETHAAVLPWAVAACAPAVSGADQLVRDVLGLEEHVELGTAVHDLLRSIGGDCALRDLGVDRHDLDPVIALLVARLEPAFDDVALTSLIHASWKGTR